jgi:hypothetical protein
MFDAENLQPPSGKAVENQIIFRIGLSLLAPEARQTAAHGGPVGLVVNRKQAPVGVEENRQQHFSSAPFRGLDNSRLESHGFTVGYYRSLLRSFNWPKASSSASWRTKISTRFKR